MTLEEIIADAISRTTVLSVRTDQAAAILAALDAGGYLVVPKEPTREMLDRGITAIENAVDTTTSSFPGADGEYRNRTYVVSTAADYALPCYRAMLGLPQRNPFMEDYDDQEDTE